MAVLAQGYDGVLLMLLDMVGIARAGGVAHRAGQLFYPGNVAALLGCEFIVHGSL